MRYFIVLFLLFGSLMAFEQKSELGVEGKGYSQYVNEVVVEGKSELKFDNEYFTTKMVLEFLYSNEYRERRYLLLNELYITKEFKEYTLSIGKEIKYWGELEGYNIADIYNQKNYLKDPFDKDAKLGTFGVNISRYFDENSLEFGVKFYEEDSKYPQNKTPFAPLPLEYDKNLQTSNERYSPTLYLKVNLVSDEILDSETSIILLRGYDTKRYFSATSATTLAQYAYRVNKAVFLSHIILDDTILKTEMAYTEVIEDKQVSDYTQLSFGIEHSLYDIFGSDITLYGEYYRYLYSDASKRKNVDISELYDNDIFIAFRVNFNDVGSSDLKLGVLEDIFKDERVFKADFHSRFFKDFVVHGEFLQILSNAKYKTPISQFDNSSRFTLGLAYTF